MTTSSRSRYSTLQLCTYLALLVTWACSIDDRDPDSAKVDAAVGRLNGGGPGADAEAEPRGLGGQGGAAGSGPETVGFDGGVVDPGGPCEICAEPCTVGVAACATASARIECTAEGVWSAPVECENVCAGESCTGECRPRSVECLSTRRFRQCSPEGAWSEALDCANACVGQACGGVCVPGAQQCTSSTRVQVCSELGEWGPEAECTNACSGAGCTGECVPGSSVCFSEAQVQSCNELGQLETPENCPLACVGTTCGGECAPGDRRCEPSTGQPQSCEGGTWVSEAACPFVCVGRGTCGGDCAPNDRRCNPATGVPQLCSAAGAWQNQLACQFVCSNGFCGGECAPGAPRCDSVTGVPQRCSAAGLWQNQAACGAGSACGGGSCVCTNGLQDCGSGCTSVQTDDDHCGACGHSCLGGECNAGRCQPALIGTGQVRPGAVVLDDTHVYWLDGDGFNTATLRRVPKGGGTVEPLVAGLGGMLGLALGGNQVYFGSNDFRTGTSERRVRRANLDGTSVTAFSPNRTEYIDRLFISNGFVFYQIIIGINASNSVFRAPLLSRGQAGAAAEVLFATIEGPLGGMAVVDGCVYYVASNSPSELMRKCTPAAQAARHYLGAGSVFLPEKSPADATHIYFNDAVRGMVRVPLAGGDFELLATVNDGVPTVDTAALYYFAQTANFGAPACTTDHTLFRAGKTVGSGNPVELLPPPQQCPSQVAVDAQAIYWSNIENGTVLKLAK